jgi:hypothetical protein
MTTYLVLASPGASIPDERSVVIADRFAPLAFIAPVIWLLFNRLWLEAVAALALLAVAAAVTGSAGQPLAGLALSLAVSAITALEGRNWRVAALQRRGWQLAGVIESDDPEAAFEIHAAQTATQTPVPDAGSKRRGLKLGRQTGQESGSIGLVPVGRN